MIALNDDMNTNNPNNKPLVIPNTEIENIIEITIKSTPIIVAFFDLVCNHLSIVLLGCKVVFCEVLYKEKLPKKISMKVNVNIMY